MKTASLSTRVFIGLIVLGVYFAAGKFGLRLAAVNPSASAVWPATGISLAVFLLLGAWVWPAIFLGAFLVNITTSGGWATSLGIAIGNTLEGVVGAWMIHRFANGRRAFHTPAGIFKFTLMAGFLATAISATVGVTSLALGKLVSWNGYGAVWLTWWMGDVVGAIIITPLLLLWSEKLHWDWDWKWILEAVSLLIAFLLVSELVFGGIFTHEFHHDPVAFFFLPLVVWVAFRFGERMTATINFLLSAVIIIFTLRGAGPFAVIHYRDPLLLLQSFIGVMGVTTLVLAVVVSERRRVTETQEKVAELKSEFTSVVSHELRTPLAVIKESVSLVLEEIDGTLNHEQKDTLQIAKKNVDRLSRLINNVLDFQKLEAGRMELQLRFNDLNKVVQDTVNGLVALAQKSSIQIQTQLVDDLPLTPFDRDQITQVIFNLLNNALKFSQPRGTITVATTYSEELLRVAVRDQGIGIKEEDQTKLFQSFSQLGNKGARKTGGSGLGLAICKRIVEMHGGEIGVDSLYGHGATFYFTLPAYSPSLKNP